MFFISCVLQIGNKRAQVKLPVVFGKAERIISIVFMYTVLVGVLCLTSLPASRNRLSPVKIYPPGNVIFIRPDKLFRNSLSAVGINYPPY